MLSLKFEAGEQGMYMSGVRQMKAQLGIEHGATESSLVRSDSNCNKTPMVCAGVFFSFGFCSLSPDLAEEASLLVAWWCSRS